MLVCGQLKVESMKVQIFISSYDACLWSSTVVKVLVAVLVNNIYTGSNQKQFP